MFITNHMCQITYLCQFIIIIMIISSFATKTPPDNIDSIIKQVFQNRLHRKFKVDKSDFQNTNMPPPNYLSKQYSQMSQQSNQSSHEPQDIILKQFQPTISPQLKHKLIKKQLGKHRFVKQQKQIHKKYNQYLTNFLHKTNLLLIKDKVPPNLSVLQTIDEGDYLQNQDNTLYERKDFPHFSNVIRPQFLQPQNNKFIFFKFMPKIMPQDRYFQVQDNCVLKLRQIYQFVSTLFKRSIQYNKKLKRLRNSQQRLKEETENHDFQIISQAINIRFQTAKLLYDILNSFYDLDREIAKGQQSKLRASSEIKESLRQILAKYHSNQAIHIPHQQQYISLRQLRAFLTQKMLQDSTE